MKVRSLRRARWRQVVDRSEILTRSLWAATKMCSRAEKGRARVEMVGRLGIQIG